MTPATRIFKILYRHFGPQYWWPADHAWEMMVGAILVQNTSWGNVEKALQALKKKKLLSVKSIALLPRSQLERLIRPSGYFRQKAERLRGFAQLMLKDPDFYKAIRGLLSHRNRDVQELRDRLLAVHGIGPETADSMLLYAGNYPAFVVDAYTRRIGGRIGLFKTERYAAVQAYFEAQLPPEAALYNEIHALFVRHAKTYCTKNAPRCTPCPLQRHCQYALLRRKIDGRSHHVRD